MSGQTIILDQHREISIPWLEGVCGDPITKEDSVMNDLMFALSFDSGEYINSNFYNPVVGDLRLSVQKLFYWLEWIHNPLDSMDREDNPFILRDYWRKYLVPNKDLIHRCYIDLEPYHRAENAQISKNYIIETFTLIRRLIIDLDSAVPDHHRPSLHTIK